MKCPLSALRIIKSIIISITFLQPATAQNNYDKVAEGFSDPPSSARPRTWWHWTNSNVTIEGITKDLEWMKRSGIGGMQLADVAAGQGLSYTAQARSQHILSLKQVQNITGLNLPEHPRDRQK